MNIVEEKIGGLFRFCIDVYYKVGDSLGFYKEMSLRTTE